jgi:hypothetical protein
MSLNLRFLAKFLILSALFQCAICSAQVDDDKAEKQAGRFLLDLSYTTTDSFEGVIDVFNPGFTWLIRPYLRVGVATTYVYFNPSKELEMVIENTSSHQGLGDSIFYVQYDWEDRLTASPWVPDNVGTVLSVLAPTGKARDFLSLDTWIASVSTSWPMIFTDSWLLNPAISYNFSFNEGPLSEPLHVAEVGLGIVRIFPGEFWIGFTPSAWYDFDDDEWNYDSHFTIGKMFSTGMGIGLDYGRTSRHSGVAARDDRNWLLNFYYQFGH